MMSKLSQRTVTFLRKGRQVLLGYKKSGFGKGNYLGIGGKIEADETDVEAAVREVGEEIGVKLRPDALNKTANLIFLFPQKPEWSQEVHVFVCGNWSGDPQETEEIKPEWFDEDNLPLSKMWDDAMFWLPAVLRGYQLKGKFYFSSDLKITKLNLQNIGQLFLNRQR